MVGDAAKVTATEETDTVAVAVAVPPGPTAVAVKVVVAAMLGTVTLPLAGASCPVTLLIVREVALDVDHVRVAEPPFNTAVGKAESCTVGGTWFTVIVTLVVAVPPGPVAVMV